MDIDDKPIPNIGNSPFYGEFHVGNMLPQIPLTTEDTKYVYHGSPNKLNVLKPFYSGNDKEYVYAAPDKNFALCYAGNQWDDLEINQAYYNGKLALTEIQPGKFKEKFDRDGYIYNLDKSKFSPLIVDNIPSKKEVVSTIPIVPTKAERIPNVWKSIVSSDITLYTYPNLPPWIKDREKYIADKINKRHENAVLEFTEEPESTKQGSFSNKGVWDAIRVINGKNYRERAEVLIFRKNYTEILLCNKNDRVRVPGGGSEPHLTLMQTAVKEAQEEVRITPTNLRYVGGYTRIYPPKDLTVLNIDLSDRPKYVGAITHLFIGEYYSEYSGYIAPVDRDEKMYKSRKWYKVKDVFNKLQPEWQDAIKMMRENINTMTESVPNRSKIPDEDFGIPSERKYPLHEKKYVLSAIKLFGRVDSKHEKELAENILNAMKKYKISLDVIGKDNKLRKYIEFVKESI